MLRKSRGYYRPADNVANTDIVNQKNNVDHLAAACNVLKLFIFF